MTDPTTEQWKAYMQELRDDGHLTDFGRGFLAGVEQAEKAARTTPAEALTDNQREAVAQQALIGPADASFDNEPQPSALSKPAPAEALDLLRDLVAEVGAEPIIDNRARRMGAWIRARNYLDRLSRTEEPDR